MTPEALQRTAPLDAAARVAARRLARLALVGLGLLLMGAGALIMPLPGPFGLPIVVLGLMVVLRNSFWAKRRFMRLHRRHPRFVSPFRRLLRPGAPVLAVLWHQTLKLERLLVPPPWRRLRRVRSRRAARPR